MRKISDFPVKGKKILVRVDLNCPVKDGKIIGDTRIRAHATTIKELSDRGARVVILSHQGRKGRVDFLSLEQHSQILERLIGKKVLFVDAVVGANATNAIKHLQDGDVIVLDNVRHLHCETEHPDGEGEIVHHLSSVADYYVLDALSVAHRKHSSVVGFSRKIPCFVGDVLGAEIEAVDKIKHGKDVTFVFGGSKVEDSFAVMKKWLSEGRAKHILVGGALAILFIKAAGHSVGDSESYLEESKLNVHVPEAKTMLEKFGSSIQIPLDVALSLNGTRSETDIESIIAGKGQIWDIGEKTIRKYKQLLQNSHFIIMNGPAGVYEVHGFEVGTKALLEGIAASKAFSLLGGGHTISAIDRFGIEKNKFSYLSLSGKALIEYLCGEALPGIAALEQNQKLFPNIV